MWFNCPWFRWIITATKYAIVYVFNDAFDMWDIFYMFDINILYSLSIDISYDIHTLRTIGSKSYLS